MNNILNKTKTRKSTGFTLVEILLVIMLIGLVMAALVKGLGGIGGQAEAAVAETFVSGGVKASVMAYKIKNGSYPNSMQDLAPYFEGKVVPKDPWGGEYQFKSPGSRNADSYDIWSNGPDKQSGTTDDIGNW